MTTYTYVRKYIATPSEVSITGTEQWSCTGMNVVTCNYLWKIEQFSFFTGEIYSQTFGAKNYKKIKWQLYIKWNGSHLAFGVKLIECDKPQVVYKLVTHIVNAQGKMLLYYKNDTLHTATKSSPNNLINLIAKANVSNKDLLPNDTLTLVCQIEMVVGHTYSVPSANADPQAVQSNFRQYLWKLYQNATFCDTALVVGGKELNVHKTVLAAHSDVFTVMFQHELEESKSNRVVITDIELDVLEEMLQFMYLGTAPNMKTMAAELMHAADKYAVEDLKKQCEIELGNNITTSTAVSIFKLAQRHSSKELEKLAKCFIKDNISDVIKEKGWQNMLEHFSDLVGETLSNMTLN